MDAELLASLETIFHFEDDPLWQSFIQELCCSFQCVKYLGAAETARRGIELCKMVMPSIAIIDLRLPDLDGLHLIDVLREELGVRKFIIFSCRFDEVMLRKFDTEIGISLVWKNRSAKLDFKTAIDACRSGNKYICSKGREAVRRFRSAPEAYFKLLSEREILLLPLFASGSLDHEIAALHGLSNATVRTHRHNIMSKLSLHSAQALTLWAIEKGFWHPSQPPLSGLE